MSTTSLDIDWSQLRLSRGDASQLPELLDRLDRDKDLRFDVLSELYAHLFRGERAVDAAEPVVAQLAIRLDRDEADEEVAILFLRLVGALEGDAATQWIPRVAALALDGPRRVRLVALAILSRLEVSGDVARQLHQAAGEDWVLRVAAHFAISSPRVWDEVVADRRESAHPLELARLLVGMAVGGSDRPNDRLEALRAALWTENWDTLASIAFHLDPSHQDFVGFLRAAGQPVRANLAPQLAAILAQTRAPAAALELAELLLEDAFSPTATDEEREAVLTALADSRGAWVYEGNLRELLGQYGIEVAGWDAFREQHRMLPPVSQFCVLPPRRDGRSLQTVRHQSHEEWIDVPWVFHGRDAKGWFDDIAEDDAYFTPTVMAEAGDVMTPLFHLMPDFARQTLTVWRFYPHLSPDTIRLYCLMRGGFEVECRPSRSTDICPLLEPSTTWSALGEAERNIARTFLAHAAEQTARDAVPWLAFPTLGYLEANPGFPVSPLALARIAIDETWRAAIALNFDSLYEDRRPYLRLTVEGAEPDSTTLLLYFPERVQPLLDCLSEHLRFMTDDSGLARFVQAVRPHVVTIFRDRGDGDRRPCNTGELS